MTRSVDRTLRAAAGLFVLAGLTGALFRVTAVYGWTPGLDPVNVRHAHSHLMYFGWVIPALFVLIGSTVTRAGGRPPSALLLYATVALAIAAWAAFLLWGYGPAVVGGARIPVGVIVSTLAMLTWYGFARWYLRERVCLRGIPSRSLLDVAVALLVASTFGAWGVAAAVPAAESLPALKAAFAHLFLALFSEGWLVAALVGLAWTRISPETRVPRWALSLLVAGTSVSFLLGMPGYLVSDDMRLVARMGGIAWGIGAVGLAWGWWKAAAGRIRHSWGPAMLLLAVKGSGQVAAMLVTGSWWADVAPVRVLYLHVLLLGFATPAIAAWLVDGRRLAVVQVASLALVVALVPQTSLWPDFLAPARPGAIAVWASLALPAAGMLLWRRRYPAGAGEES